MKVCVVGFANLMVIPYIKTYTDILKEQNIEYDIITWNRFLIDESEEGCSNLFMFNRKVDDDESIIKKIYPMLSYANYVKRILAKGKYDKVIILTSLIGVLVEGYLRKHYKGRYIFDIRDHSYEHIKWYYRKMNFLMKNSKLNVISSKGFMNFLPNHPFVVSHNCNFTQIPDNTLSKKENGKIIISFVGAIRYEEECENFLSLIKNHEKIEFRFYGRGTENILKEFCNKNGIENVSFFGEYKPHEKEGIIAESDFLFNAYGNESIHVIYAVSNKYYESMYYKKPLIVNTGTVMADISKGTAFEIEYGKTSADDIVSWYECIDEMIFNEKANEYLREALNENKTTQESIVKAILG